jgi:hypothetical protein
MEVPRYRRERQHPNNVAPIWLLRGRAKHVYFLEVTVAAGDVLFHAGTLFGSNLLRSSQYLVKGSGCGTRLAET